MSIKETRDNMKAQVWQAIAQGDVDLSGISRDKIEALVNLTVDAALLTLDEQLGQTLSAQAERKPAMDDNDEQILWRGRPFLSISTEYIITTQRVRVIDGLLGKKREDIELIRVQDLDQHQTLRERLLNVGDVIISSHDSSDPKILLNNVKDPQAVHEILRRAVLNARDRYRLSYREEM